MKKELPDRSDKELDELFREIAGKADIPYSPADWDKMKGMLDQHSVKGAGRGSKNLQNGLFITSVAVMVGMGLWFGWMFLDTETSDVENLPNLSVESNYEEEERASSPWDIIQSPGYDTFSTPSLSKTEEKPGPNSIDEEPILFQKENEVTETGGDGLQKAEEYSAQPVVEKQVMQAFSEVPAPKTTRFVSHSREKKTPFQELSKLENKEVTIIQPQTDNRHIPLDQERKGRDDYNRFGITLQLAPDVSALKIKDIHGLGSSVGLNMEYFIRKNLSLNAGALYAFKTYRGTNGYNTEYAPSPTGVSGDCWILELPVNIRYYAIENELHKWFVSTGMSSYLMLREKYDLEYTPYGSDPYTDRLEIKNSNRHYWGIVNISAGYERVLSNRLSIQVEPYLKLPVSGVGEGDVNLKSAGALIGLKYSW